MDDALERAKEEAWAYHESVHGMRRDSSGVRYLAGLSVEESEFIIDWEAKSEISGKVGADPKYIDLIGRHEVRRIGEYVRKREGIVEH
jgi:hypothetical protein